jgi:hypothetical protein
MNRNTTDELSEKEIARRMEDGIRRALSTPPKPTRELVGKSKRTNAKRQIRKSDRKDQSTPKDA